MKIPYRFYYNSYTVMAAATGEALTHIPALDGYQEGDRLTLAHESEIEVANDTGDVQICEVLFFVFNDLWSRPDEYRGPSMSVGDVVTLIGIKHFACAQMGFTTVDISKSKLLPAPPEWTRTNKELETYKLRKRAEMERNIA